MLTKSDLGKIEELLQKNVKNSLIEFFETLISPYFDHNEEDHKEIKAILKVHGKQLEENDRDHDRIFRSREGNKKEHDEMFVKLDSIESSVKDHEKRIKHLEQAAVVA